MKWQIVGEVGFDSPDNRLLSPTPVREHVPMEEQEARANRYVSLLVGSTVSDRQQLNSSKAHHSLLELQRRVVEGKQARWEELVFHKVGRLGLLSDR